MLLRGISLSLFHANQSERKNRFPEITDKDCQKAFSIVLPNDKILAEIRHYQRCSIG